MTKSKRESTNQGRVVILQWTSSRIHPVGLLVHAEIWAKNTFRIPGSNPEKPCEVDQCRRYLCSDQWSTERPSNMTRTCSRSDILNRSTIIHVSQSLRYVFGYSYMLLSYWMQDLGSTGTMEHRSCTPSRVTLHLMLSSNTPGFYIASSPCLFDSYSQFLVFDFRANELRVRLRYDPRAGLMLRDWWVRSM